MIYVYSGQIKDLLKLCNKYIFKEIKYNKYTRYIDRSKNTTFKKIENQYKK